MMRMERKIRGKERGWLRHVSADFFLISTRRHHWGKKKKISLYIYIYI